jgi:hypothetical protein
MVNQGMTHSVSSKPIHTISTVFHLFIGRAEILAL